MKTLMSLRGNPMKLYFLAFCLIGSVFLITGCTKVSEEELQAKVDKCSDAGMNYTYLRDYRGEPYEVMCVSKRLR
jgi:hypothetical protein